MSFVVKPRYRFAAAATAAVCGLSALSGSWAPLAAAKPVPLTPNAPEIADQWRNPYVRAHEADTELTVELEELSSPRWDPTETLLVTAIVRNTGASVIDNAEIVLKRSDATTNPHHAGVMLTVGEQDYPHELARAKNLRIPAGGERTVTLRIPPIDDELAAGVYPMALFATGGEQADSDRFFMSTTTLGTSMPAADDNTGVVEDSLTDPVHIAPEPTGLTMLIPITAATTITPGETGEAPNHPPLYMNDDTLAHALVSGGRLDRLLDLYIQRTRENQAVKQATCLALDPQLVDAVARMSDGYQVSDKRPSPVAPTARLRDRWTSKDSSVNAQAGRSNIVAGEWITKLRRATEDGCVVSLPWANADINAIGTVGNQWLARETLTRGRDVLPAILGRELSSDVVIPPSGYLSDQAASVARLSSSALTPDEAWNRQRRAVRPHEPSEAAPDVLSTPSMPAEQPVDDPTLHRAQVLVADTSNPVAADGVEAIGFDAGVASMLARMGSDPAITPYSPSDYRFDARFDSQASRRQSAGATLELAASSARAAAGTGERNELLVLPPSELASADAQRLFDEAEYLLNQRLARPVDLQTYLDRGVPPDNSVDIMDPTELSTTEIVTAQQQTAYIDELARLMVNDPNIALTPYGFSTPLRYDIIRAFSFNGRAALSRHAAVTTRTERLLSGNRDMLLELRDAVILLPPGNVYTRTSPSSPLLIVARNGLPLPVETRIGYLATEGVKLGVPQQLRIPAKGSITTELTASIPADSSRTDVELFLLTPTDTMISNPVDISVQTRSGLLSRWFVITALVGLLVMATARMVRTRRRPVRGHHRTAAEHALTRSERRPLRQQGASIRASSTPNQPLRSHSAQQAQAPGNDPPPRNRQREHQERFRPPGGGQSK